MTTALALRAQAPATPAPRLLYTLVEAAHLLHITKRTLNRLIAKGEFPKPLRIGSRSYVVPDELAAYVERLKANR